MLGFRGAARYYDPRYRDGFALECQAMRKVRDEMGLTNVKLMIPFCRTVDEGRKVLAEMAKHRLRRGENGLEVYVMCEVPSNVILAEAFAEIFDGFSIGSNDLTQLVLGVDRDSAIVAHLFDERDMAARRSFNARQRPASRRTRPPVTALTHVPPPALARYSSSSPAASASDPGNRWPYRSNVMVTDE